MSLAICFVIPELLDKQAEHWAQWYFERPTSSGQPDTRFAEDASLLICEIEEEEPTRSRVEIGTIVLERIAEIHERYSEWTTAYSAAQLSQGLWAMFSHPGMFGDLMLSPELPSELRARAIRSLVIPYRDYVQGWNLEEAMPHGWEMLWDMVFGPGQMPDETADIFLASLEEILSINDKRCQAAALHGLNHLDHPRRPAVVQAWINAHRNEGWNISWLEACRDGKAM